MSEADDDIDRAYSFEEADSALGKRCLGCGSRGCDNPNCGPLDEDDTLFGFGDDR